MDRTQIGSTLVATLGFS